jgi:formiminoglutamase
MNPFEIIRGDSAIVFGIPHAGLYVPDDAASRLNKTGRALADTDWHIDRLYDGLLPGVTTVRATFHRYLIDANRDPSGASLYPGQNTTGLCPLTDFDGLPLYEPGAEPDEAEIERRRQAFHAPYHAALAAEIDRVRRIHGQAILYDCHSIRSHIPYLFEGTLPDFNIGTSNSTTCAPIIESEVARICGGVDGYTSIVNGRFKGGWTTRHYGKPPEGIHAIQMELAQSAYMVEAPSWDYLPENAEKLRAVLSTILARLNDLAASGKLKSGSGS